MANNHTLARFPLCTWKMGWSRKDLWNQSLLFSRRLGSLLRPHKVTSTLTAAGLAGAQITNEGGDLAGAQGHLALLQQQVQTGTLVQLQLLQGPQGQLKFPYGKLQLLLGQVLLRATSASTGASATAQISLWQASASTGAGSVTGSGPASALELGAILAFLSVASVSGSLHFYECSFGFYRNVFRQVL